MKAIQLYHSLCHHSAWKDTVSFLKEALQLSGIAFLAGILCAMLISVSWDIFADPAGDDLLSHYEAPTSFRLTALPLTTHMTFGADEYPLPNS